MDMQPQVDLCVCMWGGGMPPDPPSLGVPCAIIILFPLPGKKILYKP